MFSNKLSKYTTIWIIFTASLSAQIPNIVINEFLTSNAHINYDPDYINYSDWLELYNTENYQVNLNGYYLTDDLTNPTKWRITDDIIIEPNGYFVFWADNEDAWHHTNFQLNKDGEQIGIYMPDGSIVDTVIYNPQQTDISFGRNPNNESEWLYYYNPTPGASNNTIGNTDLTNCSEPIFSEGSGFYSSDISLEITADPNSEIRYTLDGSEPDENSQEYTVPINISDRVGEPNYFSEIPTNINPLNPWIRLWNPPVEEILKVTVVRARIYSLGKLPSSIVTNSYFVGSEVKNDFSTIPVISLVSDERHLFSDSSGIYVPGISFAGGVSEGNYNKNWNRPAHIQYFDESGELQISQEVDIRTQGNTSSASPQKGLHIIARDKYGKNSIEYPFFKNGKSKANKLTSFKRFILRAWGSVWDWGMVKDALAQTSYARSSLDIQDYRPAIVFINGEYWGLQEIREANKNPYYFEGHYGIDKDDPGFDIIMGGTSPYYIDEGDDNHWQNMLSFINNNEMSIAQNYEYVKTQMDVDNFIDYIGHNVYFAKIDWPPGNEAFWRPRTIDGRWRWIQYDMDFCFWGEIDFDMFDHIFYSTNSTPHPLLRELIKNQQFKIKFINWFLDRINSEFNRELIFSNYNEILNEIYPYLTEHLNRWALSEDKFNFSKNEINGFIYFRHYHIISHLQFHFNLGELNTLIIDRTSEGGTVKVNSVLIDENAPGISENPYEWKGKYFEDVPIQLIAIPNEGYAFDHWEGSIESQSGSISFYLDKTFWLSAVFSPIEKVDSLFINEISADNNSIIADSSGKFEDWIELYNASNDTIDLAGLYFTDDFTEPTKWKIPLIDSIQFNILPGKHQILWCDNDSEEEQDHLGFTLNKIGEMIGITQITGNDTVLIDSVSFSEQLPNVSYGRFPDASDKWEILLIPTPGSSNIYRSIFEEQLNSPQLFQNYPNPFNVKTSIPFYLTKKNDITIDIYNIEGKLIRSYTNKQEDIGYSEFLWDGRDDSGKTISSGIYFYNLHTDQLNQTKKMLFLK